MKRILVCIALLVLAESVMAQTGAGRIQGTVTDTSGAVVPGARVTATHIATARQFATTSNQVGFYLFPSAQNGQYRVTVETAGMEEYKGEFLLQTGQTAVVDAVLRVGATTTEVTVVADAAPLVTTTSPTLAVITERARIDQLPISGRFFQTLVSQTTPGVETGSRVWGIRWGIEYVQDGAVMVNRDTGELSGRPPGMDTIEEYRVETSVSSAKMNRPGAVIVNTRAGTNQFHGSLFEVARNNDLGFGVARRREEKWSRPSHLVRNEFGASGGGPLYIPKVYNGKNKTFFFQAYEAYRSLSGTTLNVSVPTMAMRQGDFSGLVDSAGRKYTLYDPWTTTANWSRQPFANNQIPLQRESALAKYLYSVTPQPTIPEINPLVGSNWWGQVPNNRLDWTMTTRVDHRLSDRDQFFFRYTHGVRDAFAQSGTSPVTLDNSANARWRPIRDDTGVASWTHTFSPSFFSETLFTAGVEDMAINNIGDDKKYADTLGLPNPFNEYGFPNISSTGVGMTYTNPDNRRNNISHVYNVDENLTKVVGRHEIQFGGRYRFEKLYVLADQQNPQGDHSFGSQATGLYDPASGSTYGAVSRTGHTTADLFLGVINSYAVRFVRKWYTMNIREAGLYFQDNFKVNSRLTLNYGLRWELTTPPREKNNFLTGFDPKSKSIVNGADLDTMYKLGSTLPSIVRIFESMGIKFISPSQAGLPDNLMYLNKWDFNPRAGFAYKLSGGPRPIVMRGGYGVYGYPMPLRAFDARMRSNPPTTARFTYQLSNSAQTPDKLPNWALRSVPTLIAGVNSRDVINLDNPDSISRGSFTVSYFDPHQPTTRGHEWNWTLEREMLENTVVRLGYSGTHGSRLDMYNSLNQAPTDYIWFTREGLALPTGTYASTARRGFENTMFGDIEAYQKTGWSNSQNFRLELQRRYAKGYGFQLFYVLSNSMRAAGNGWSDDVLSPTNVFMPGAVPADAAQRARLLYYRRDTDIPKHRCNWNFIVDLPFGKGKHFLSRSGPVLDRIVGGWQLAGSGSRTSTWWALPTGNWVFPNQLEIYGTKYKVQDCRSGLCYEAYLYYNGYIPANRINSYDATGKPNGVMGVPSSYKPAHTPLLPIPANGGSASDPMYAYYETNTVWVTLKNGASQRTTLDTNLNPWRNQFKSGLYDWSQSASLFKIIPVNERVSLRLNIDFFNVFNMPGIPKTPNSTTGLIDAQLSGNGARALQFGLRLNW